MKSNSQILLSKNEEKIIECIKRNVLVGAKDIIQETNIPERTVRRTLKNLLDKNYIETTETNEKSPNKKYRERE